MGNTILSDDAVGILVAQEIEKIIDSPEIDVVCTQAAGFTLVDLLTGYEKAIVVDAIISDRAPAGEVYWLDLVELERPINNLSNHNIHLADALRLGQNLGLDMPRAVKVLAIEVEDCLTLSENIGEVAKSSIPKAVQMILQELGLEEQDTSEASG